MSWPAPIKKFWWQCNKCGYEWETGVYSRIRGRGCPCCANKVAVAGVNDLQTKFPKIAAQWHPTKNDNLKPCMIVCGSHRKVWWLCPDCGHEWMAIIANRKNGNGCPECAKKKRAELYAKAIA